jgi:hypothetical protein
VTRFRAKPEQRAENKPHPFLALTLLAFLFVPAAHAQFTDSGLWFSASGTGKLPQQMNDAKGSWRLWTDGQLRLGDNMSRFSQGLIRPGVGYALNPAWTVWLGYAYIRTDQPYAKTPSNEQRVWEQLSWQRLIGRTDLSSRTRLEERFHSAGSDTGVRFRELGKVMHPLGKGVWLISVYDEIFVNLNTANFGPKAGADRNRFFAGPGFNVGPPLRFEVGYLNQYTFNNNGPDRIDNIFSINAFWNFSRKASPPEE